MFTVDSIEDLDILCSDEKNVRWKMTPSQGSLNSPCNTSDFQFSWIAT